MKKHSASGALSLTAVMLGAAIISLATSVVTAAAALQLVAPRCEYRINPQGIDEALPRLTWRVESMARGQKQTAYQILVASSAAALKQDVGDLWDSGKVASSETVNVVYAGQPLASPQQCYWKIHAWDKDGRASWSEPASWTMGLLKPDDWSADYISFRDASLVWKDATNLFLPPARQYRKEFAAAKTVKRATIYATALGIYELYLNGERVGDARFAPGWTDYHQRAYYNTYDVTALMKQGRNAVGAWLADGWYSGYIGCGLLWGVGTEAIGRYSYGKTPALMAQLEIEYSDGTRETVVTDKSWQVTGDGPIREGDFLMGEFYMRGWKRRAGRSRVLTRAGGSRRFSPGKTAACWQPFMTTLTRTNPAASRTSGDGRWISVSSGLRSWRRFLVCRCGRLRKSSPSPSRRRRMASTSSTSARTSRAWCA